MFKNYIKKIVKEIMYGGEVLSNSPKGLSEKESHDVMWQRIQDLEERVAALATYHKVWLTKPYGYEVKPMVSGLGSGSISAAVGKSSADRNTP